MWTARLLQPVHFNESGGVKTVYVSASVAHENGNVIGTKVNLHFTKCGKYTSNFRLNAVSNTYRIMQSILAYLVVNGAIYKSPLNEKSCIRKKLNGALCCVTN